MIFCMRNITSEVLREAEFAAAKIRVARDKIPSLEDVMLEKGWLDLNLSADKEGS